MCGRYTLTRDEIRFAKRLALAERSAFAPRYNIAPTQHAPVILAENHRPVMKMLRWGWVRGWAKNGTTPLINARSETVCEKPSFREAFKRRRCLVPADGFYEWLKLGDRKQPVRIVLNGEEVFAMAGLWDSWADREGHAVEGFTILTTRSNALLEPIHDRMPVVIPEAHWATWLDAEADPELLRGLLVPFPPDQMQFYRVNRIVNDARRDEPACIEPLCDEGTMHLEQQMTFSLP